MTPSPPNMPAIVVDGVSKSFRSRGAAGDIVALNDISFTIESGQFVTLLGPSGCGKSTVLRLVDGLIAPDRGRIEVVGAPPRPSAEIGFVFQSFRLLPWETVASNIEFALAELGLAPAERDARVADSLALVGLGKFAQAYPGELSGGMRQRVALARALVGHPKVLLMDEPFASIDAQTRELMQLELMRIWEQRKPTVMFVTHSVDEAIVLSERIILMGPRPGHVVEAIDVGLEHPRRGYDVRSHPRFVELRSYLSRRMSELVLSDVNSEFHGRDVDLSNRAG